MFEKYRGCCDETGMDFNDDLYYSEDGYNVTGGYECEDMNNTTTSTYEEYMPSGYYSDGYKK